MHGRRRSLSRGVTKTSLQTPGRWALLLAAIVLVCAIALRDIKKGEFDYNVDEAQHAVTGLFVADALRDLPLRHPIQYARVYYAQYSAIAILHWPPLLVPMISAQVRAVSNWCAARRS